VTRNLETADAIAKLVLASATIILYFTGLISGPFAVALVLLSVCVLLIFLLKYLLTRKSK